MREGSPDRKWRYCQKFSPGPARFRPCRPWMTVAAIRRDSRMRRGNCSASVRAWPLALWVALTSCPAARRFAAIGLSEARQKLAHHSFDRLAVGARREGERHAVLEDRLRH